MKHTHEIVWTQPSPLWGDPRPGPRTAERAGFETPSILRFNTDSFMEEFVGLLATDPSRLAEYRVRPETWRGFTKPPEPANPLNGSLLRRLGLSRKKPGGLNGHLESRLQSRRSP